MLPRKPASRRFLLASLAGALAIAGSPLAQRAFAAPAERRSQAVSTLACDPSRCPDARSAARHLLAASAWLQRRASALAAAEIRNAAAEAAANHARDCASRAKLLAGQSASTLPVAFSSAAASCGMASVELRQARLDASQAGTR